MIFSTGCNFHRNKRDDTPIKNPDSSNRDQDQEQEQEEEQNFDLTQIQSEPYYKYAWHFAYNRTFGQYYGINQESNIHIEDAWKITRGKGITVAIIDASNFDWNHEDLKSNVFMTYNSDEDNNNISNQGETDELSHGSTVAGFIASPINGKGLVGAAPESKLILIKQIDASDAATIKAFEYAKDNGAKVINCSWGTEQVSQSVASELQELKNEGITIIFASGNEGANMDDYSIHDESELPSVIGVGSSNEYNDISSYSNYGSEIDILAPGGNINNGVGILGIDDRGEFGNTLQRSIVTNDYSFTNGTSFSAPIATGVVALMLSVNSSLTPAQIREILILTADKIGDNANYDKHGFDFRRAYGKLNAANAVKMAKDY
jgi:subtilisin family serine protease